ncbi:hypothetical protein V6N11_071068 [Hibiscus sabdariffa]|uniref:Uncharacterized protein n=2 Tax=Hibiscus sabdariffa TaxID=183260 RepID=A0ABR2A770_9ROSI
MFETDKQWVASVRDIAYEVEDVVDEFMYHFNKQQQWRTKPSRFFFKLIHFPKDMLVKHRVAVKLKDINKRIKSIVDRNQRFRTQRQLLGWLMDQELQRTVISVVGMGGLELFKSIIKGLYNKAKEKIDSEINLDSMSYLEFLEELVNFLQPRIYLIVIDDIWSTNLWQDINMALPTNMNGSRILLTTWKKD